MATIDDIPIGVAVVDTDAFRYVVVYDKRDLSREYFRSSLRGGTMRHVDRDALPENVADRLWAAIDPAKAGAKPGKE